jgi:hypothetical protein
MLWLELMAPEAIEVPPRTRFSQFFLTGGRYKRYRCLRDHDLLSLRGDDLSGSLTFEIGIAFEA